MSTTIGLGYLTIDNSEIYAELKSIAEKFGYGFLNGIEYSESDVRPGLEVMQKNENWKHILFLQSLINDDVSLAFGIDQELNSLGLTGARPKFFDFLNEVSPLATQKCKKFGVFLRGNDMKVIEFGMPMGILIV